VPSRFFAWRSRQFSKSRGQYQNMLMNLCLRLNLMISVGYSGQKNAFLKIISSFDINIW
jgi:hypothetical protein